MRMSVAVCGVILALAGSVFGADSTKVAYVDIDRVTSKAKAVHNVMGDIQDQVKGIQESIESKRKQIRDLESDLKRTEGVLAREEQEKKRKEILRLREELDQLDFEARQKMRRMDETVFSPILKKIVFAIEDVAKEDKIDLVLRGEAVIYGSSTVDITDKVIEKMNASETTTVRERSKTEATEKTEESSASIQKSKGETAGESSGSSSSRKGTRPVDRQRD